MTSTHSVLIEPWRVHIQQPFSRTFFVFFTFGFASQKLCHFQIPEKHEEQDPKRS